MWLRSTGHLPYSRTWQKSVGLQILGLKFSWMSWPSKMLGSQPNKAQVFWWRPAWGCPVLRWFSYEIYIIAKTIRVINIASANSSAGNPRSLLFQTRKLLLKFGSSTPNSGWKIITKNLHSHQEQRKQKKTAVNSAQQTWVKQVRIKLIFPWNLLVFTWEAEINLDCLSNAVKKRGVASSLFTLGAAMPCFTFGLLPEAQTDLLSQGVFSFPDFYFPPLPCSCIFFPMCQFSACWNCSKDKAPFSPKWGGWEATLKSDGEMLLLSPGILWQVCRKEKRFLSGLVHDLAVSLLCMAAVKIL